MEKDLKTTVNFLKELEKKATDEVVRLSIKGAISALEIALIWIKQ